MDESTQWVPVRKQWPKEGMRTFRYNGEIIHAKVGHNPIAGHVIYTENGHITMAAAHAIGWEWLEKMED